MITRTLPANLGNPDDTGTFNFTSLTVQANRLKAVIAGVTCIWPPDPVSLGWTLTGVNGTHTITWDATYGLFTCVIGSISSTSTETADVSFILYPTPHYSRHHIEGKYGILSSPVMQLICGSIDGRNPSLFIADFGAAVDKTKPLYGTDWPPDGNGYSLTGTVNIIPVKV